MGHFRIFVFLSLYGNRETARFPILVFLFQNENPLAAKYTDGVRVYFGNWIFPLWMGITKQKKIGLFDFRFEAQNQQLNYSAFFFHFHFLITIYKMKFKVNRNEKTDQKQALFIFSHRKSDRSAWSGTIKDSLMTMTAAARMDQYILFRKNKSLFARRGHDHPQVKSDLSGR